MIKRSRIAIALVIAFCLLLTCQFALGKEVPKPAKIVAHLDTTMLTPEVGQAQFCAEFKKLTGIELQIIQPPHNQYNEKLLLSFASNEIPDIVEIQPDNPLIHLQMVDEGAIIPLTKMIARSKVCKEIDDMYFDSLTVKGQKYFFPFNQGGGCVTYIRQDWLDNLKMKAPTTWDELYAVMKAFTFNDPDGNGKHDTVGYTFPGFTQDLYMTDFLWNGSYDFMVKRNKWVDGFSQPEFRGALERLRKVYQEKLLDQDVFTNATSTAREKFYAGKVGIFQYWSGTWGKQMSDNTKQSNPKAVVVALPPIKEASYCNRFPIGLAITKACKYPEAVFKYFFETMYDGGKGQMLFVHGVEGVHWAKGADGKVVKLPTLNNPKLLSSKSYVHPELALRPWDDPVPLDPLITASRKANLVRMRQLYIPPPSPTYMKNGANLLLLKKEIMGKVMMGQMTVDEGLATYKTKAAALGLANMIKEMNAAK